MTPEEKLLRAIFGEKASDVRDTSLRLPPGVNGTVVEVRVFNRHGVEKDERAMAIEREEIERLAKDRDDELQILDRNVYARLKSALLGKEAAKGPKNARKGTHPQRGGAGRAAAQPVVGDRAGRRGRHGRGGGHRQAVRGRQEEPGAALRRQGRQAAARRRAAARRHEDGQGLRGREAQDPAGRQDGRPARQQGRGVDDRARRGHALPGGRHPRRRRAQSAGRAEPHERRADPRDASGMGLPRAGPHHRRGAAQVPRGRRRPRRCATRWPTSTARTASRTPASAA